MKCKECQKELKKDFIQVTNIHKEFKGDDVFFLALDLGVFCNDCYEKYEKSYSKFIGKPTYVHCQKEDFTNGKNVQMRCKKDVTTKKAKNRDKDIK